MYIGVSWYCNVLKKLRHSLFAYNSMCMHLVTYIYRENPGKIILYWITIPKKHQTSDKIQKYLFLRSIYIYTPHTYTPEHFFLIQRKYRTIFVLVLNFYGWHKNPWITCIRKNQYIVINILVIVQYWNNNILIHVVHKYNHINNYTSIQVLCMQVLSCFNLEKQSMCSFLKYSQWSEVGPLFVTLDFELHLARRKKTFYLHFSLIFLV